MINRERKINVEQLSLEQIKELEQQISNRLCSIIDDACSKANKILNVYGLQAKMQFALDPIVANKPPSKAKKPKRKTSTKKKVRNKTS